VKLDIDGRYIFPDSTVPRFPVPPVVTEEKAVSEAASEEADTDSTESDSSDDEDDDSKSNEDEFCVPEQIVGERKGQYHVKWVGWDTRYNTWEPQANFAGRAYAKLRKDWDDRKKAKVEKQLTARKSAKRGASALESQGATKRQRQKR
jgi:hypothetical protein